MRLLLTGAAGMLGRDLSAAAGRAGHDVVERSRGELDIRDAAAVRAAVAAAAPDAVINCAAWTDVDGAESSEAAATRLNGAAAGHVAAAAAAAGAFTVQVSTDYVFDGRATVPTRVVPDRPAQRLRPLQARGRARGRRRRPGRARDRAHLVAVRPRTARNFVATMLRLAAERDELTVVDDQIGCPTFTGHLADALVEIADRRLGGVRHVAGGGACSWHDLAAATFATTGATVALARGSTADLGRPAPRPAFSVLRTERPDTPVLPPWQDGLNAYLELGVTA